MMAISRVLRALAAALLLISCSPAFGVVCVMVGGSGDGSSWLSPLGSIQAGVDAAFTHNAARCRAQTSWGRPGLLAPGRTCGPVRGRGVRRDAADEGGNHGEGRFDT